MKSFVKVLALAPAMLVALTACEAKIDEEAAKERVAAYDAAAVAEKYEEVEIAMSAKVNKATGVFGKDGILEALTEVFKSVDEKETMPAEYGMFTFESFDDLVEEVNSASANTANAKVELNYYSYKSTGLKVVASASAKMEEEGAKASYSTSVTEYVHDDGRIEKADASFKISMSGKSAGISVDGTLDVSMKLTTKWVAAKQLNIKTKYQPALRVGFYFVNYNCQ